MRLDQAGTPENVELHGKLRLGGRWYYRGDTVQMSPEDAVAMRSRGLAAKARHGVRALNAPEVVKPVDVEVQTKAAEPETAEQRAKTGTWTKTEVETAFADKGARNAAPGKRR